MPTVMAHLILFDGFGKEEGAPVGYAADYATLGEDQSACCAGDSEGRMLEDIPVT